MRRIMSFTTTILAVGILALFSTQNVKAGNLSGLYMLLAPSQPVPTDPTQYKSYVTGVTLRVPISKLESKEGCWNWTYIDQSLATLQGLGITKVKLDVMLGVDDQPSWVLTVPGIHTANLWNKFTKSYTKMALPWDPIYISQVCVPVIDALAAKYAGDSRVVDIGMSGPTGTGELPMPQKVNGSDPYLIAAGYTPDKVYSAWKTVINEFAMDFGTTKSNCSLDLGVPYSTTDTITCLSADTINRAGTPLLNAIVNYAVAKIGSKLSLQQDGLNQNSNTTYAPDAIINARSSARTASHPYGGSVNCGFQFTSSIYGQNQFGASVGSYPKAFSAGSAMGGEYYEVYYQDMENVITSVAITNAGSGYSKAPSVSFAGGSPVSCAAAAAAVSNGRVTGITVKNVGCGYCTYPSVTISGTGTRATAVAILGSPYDSVFTNEAKSLPVIY
ncbi:MAG: hypothetical protein ACP5SH_04770 [Syntrophobacteraceae bacterium]